MKYAVIDIGSNSVRLMLWADGPLYKRVVTTRLAEGLSASGVLSDEACSRTVAAIGGLCREGRDAGARIAAFATAAVRSAANGRAFCNRVKRECGVEVDVVSGEEEALLGLCGALGDSDGGIIDIGGASTEVCIRRGGNIAFSVSLPVGVVRLLERCGQDKEKLIGAACEAVRPLAAARGKDRLYAIGGTASTLASIRLGLSEYDAGKLAGLSLSAQYLGEIGERLLGLTVEQRKRIPGMDVRRADVIAGGAVLLYEAVCALGADEVRFSDGDNLEGYLLRRGMA